MVKNNLSPLKDFNTAIYDEILEERLAKFEIEKLLVAIVDNIVPDALPHLAEQYHITGNEGWLQVRNDAEKRELIKKAIEMHRYKGTKHALNKIFSMFGLQGNIQEWFEYGGKPYHFKIDLDFVSKGLDFILIEKLEDLVNEYKNVRSHLESLKISMSTSLDVMRLKSASISGEIVSVYPLPRMLVFDETNWDEKNWCKPTSEKVKLPTLRWGILNLDESAWAYG